jgi:hypothetical protein
VGRRAHFRSAAFSRNESVEFVFKKCQGNLHYLAIVGDIELL